MLSLKAASRTRSHAALALVVLATGGCTNGTAGAPAAGGDDSSATGGKGPTPGAAGNGFGLSIRALTPDGVDVDAPHLKPSAIADIVAHVTPPGVHTVRFALLGSPLDAVLSLTESITDGATGDAHVRLIAPSTPTTFQVQASTTGALPAPISLAVPQTGMAFLGVQPSYGGERPILNGYVASAWLDTTCLDLGGNPPDEDGPLVATSSGFPVQLLVPTGTKLAVTLRAARFAWGCTTVNPVTEGAPNDVEVVMTNVPMKLDASLIDFTLELDTVAELQAALADSEQAALAAFLGTAADDGEALLDAMQTNAQDGDAFRAARAGLEWDALVRDELGAGDALRTPLATWIEAGISGTNVASGLLGSIQGTTGGPPSIALTSVFGVSPSVAGFTATGTATWAASADDRVVIGMSMSVSPAKYLFGAALGPALAEVTTASTLSAALADLASCDQVAHVLVKNGKTSGHSTSDCDTSCTTQLCATAIDSLLDAALASDQDNSSTLDIALTGSGSVGDDAELTGLGGGDCSWLGRWSDPAGTTTLSGPASGAAPKTVAP